MAEEFIDVVDEKNVLTGKKVKKSLAHQDGIWHRAAHIWLYNAKGEILLQLRAKDKQQYPDSWDCSAGGHVSAGEEVITSALASSRRSLA